MCTVRVYRKEYYSHNINSHNIIYINIDVNAEEFQALHKTDYHTAQWKSELNIWQFDYLPGQRVFNAVIAPPSHRMSNWSIDLPKINWLAIWNRLAVRNQSTCHTKSSNHKKSIHHKNLTYRVPDLQLYLFSIDRNHSCTEFNAFNLNRTLLFLLKS